MKKFTINILASAIVLVAWGCSSPTAMQSTEYDDMYYSSSDRTTYAEPTSSVEQTSSSSGVQNQTYAGNSNASVTDNYYVDEYYDGREYNPRDNWYRPNYSYVDPYWGSAYTPRHYSYNRYNSAFYDPFYDPFYHDPFYYDPFFRRPFLNSGVSVIISYNYGFGGRYPYYSRWYPNNPYYHGFYGGHYNNFYGNNWFYDRPVVIGNRVKTQYGPRDTRGSVVTEGNDRNNNGRPTRGEAYQGEVTGTENARPTRPSRTSDAVISPEVGSEAKPQLPLRPSRTEYYDPSQGRDRNSRQPINQDEQQSDERRVIDRSERRGTRTREYTPTPRSTETRTRTREYRVPQQQQQRPVESRPVRREERREVSPPPSRSNDRIENNNNSSSSSSSSSESRGGRPTRGQ